MKFNRLYLHGFKSFVDKTTIEFPDGITAIVGPNGSGKSNVMDAVRWVFGEQNAKELRGTEMEDVVFNGSQKRKPAGFAEVGLTLSDIDESVASKYGTFSDLTITRKFYKTGEREYYINNRKCRLKDIKDIFMDTGLGARSISIIEQGKVDKIINASPEELRFFLEETAGVTKFKDKKREAERRLSQTRDNLDRVNDIITEILGRLELLSSQVEVLKQSESLQTEKRNLEKRYLASSFASKMNEQLDKTSQKKIAGEKLEKKLAEYATVVKEEGKTNTLLTELSEQHKNLQEKRLETSNNATKIEGEIHSLNIRLSTAEEQRQQIVIDIERLSKEVERIEDIKEILSDKKEIAESETEELSDKVADIEDIISDIKTVLENSQDDFNELDEQFLSYTSNISEKRSDLLKREMSLEHQLTVIDRLKREKEEIADQSSLLNEQKSALSNDVETSKQKLENAKKSLAEFSESYDLLKQDDEKFRIKQAELSSSIKSISSNITFLETQIINASTGNSDDMQYLNRYSPKLLIDLINNVDRVKLVEIADVFCFDDNYKNEVIQTIEKLELSIRFTFTSEIESITKMLDNIDVIGSEHNIYYKSHIYTKHGSDEASVKIISLKEHVKQATLDIDTRQKELEEVSQNIEKLAVKMFENKEEVDLLQYEVELVNKSLFDYTTKHDNIANEYERGNKRINTIEREIALAEDTYNEYETICKKIKIEISEIDEKRISIEEEREVIEEKLNNIKSQLDDKKETLQELKIELSGANERLASAVREADNIEREYNNNTQSLNNLNERLHNLLNVDKIDWQKNIEQLTENHKQLNLELLKIESELSELDNSIIEHKETAEELHKSAESINSQIKEVDDEVRQLDLALASASSFTEAIATQYSEKFGENLAECYQEYADADFKPNKTKDEIAKLDNQLESLGAINLNAINDHAEAEDRYNFLTSQRTDLEGSITDINSFIYETDQTTVKMFFETYDKVKDKFIEVFKILFGDGEAELRLTDPEDILNTGVEIYIQPPGKKLQHMGLLSGGEKALTAMTLLFALFLQKPTPFCFLDEVDAPLDDANVARYTSMVKALADRTQFILITHNHNTMAAADSLYGVTMQEFGVSSVLSVKLEQISQAGR